MRRINVILIALALAIPAGAQTVSLSLEDCRRMASESNTAILNAALDEDSARALKEEALAEYFPSVSAMGLGFHSLNPLIDIGVTDILGKSDYAWEIKNTVDETFPQYGLPTHYKALQYGYGVSVNIVQPVFAGGRIVSGNRLASLGVEASGLQKKITTRTSLEEVNEKYWTVLSLQNKMEIHEGAIEMVESLEKDASSAYAAGLITESDVLKARLKLNELKTTRSQLRGGTRLAKMDLFNAIHQDYSAIKGVGEAPYIDEITLSESLEGLVSPDNYYVPEEELASRMEENRLLELQIEAAELKRKMTLGEALPEVGLGALYGYSRYLGDGGTNGALYAMVKIPLSDWGKASKRLRRDRNEIEKARNDQAYLSSQLTLLARKLWVELTTSWEQLEVAKESVALAEDALEKIRAGYGAGLATMSEVLEAETELHRSEDALSDASISYLKSLSAWASRL